MSPRLRKGYMDSVRAEISKEIQRHAEQPSGIKLAAENVVLSARRWNLTKSTKDEALMLEAIEFLGSVL